MARSGPICMVDPETTVTSPGDTVLSATSLIQDDSMTKTSPNLFLLTPLITDAVAFAGPLEAACAAGGVAAVMLRLADADERTQINRVKTLAPIAQKFDSAVIVTTEGETPIDIANLAARGGADGVHIPFDEESILNIVLQLKGERSLGIGNLRSKDDAMRCGELGADYLMFGEPRRDGSLPARETVLERAQWWSDIFETPCVIFSPDIENIGEMVATGAEFIALGDAIWTHGDGIPAAIEAVRKAVEGSQADRG